MIVELFYMDTTIWAKTPYNTSFVKDLKEEIPKDYRYWDSSEKVWVVNYSYEAELIALCETYFARVIKYGKKRHSAPAAITSPSPAYQTLFLTPSAPKELIVAAYRVLAKLYHPDVNKEANATEKMKRVNIAFDEIMGRR